MIRVIEFLPLLNALAEGKTIQYLTLGGEWKDAKINYISDFTEDDEPEYYRIKPESQLVPFSFEDAEFLIGKPIRSKQKNVVLLIQVVYQETVMDHKQAMQL